MCQASKALPRRIRVNGAEAAEMPGVQCLKKVEGLCPAHLTHEDPIRSMTQRSAQEIGDRDRRERGLLAERGLCPARFEAHHVGFVEMDLGGFLDYDDT